ncbi:MAG: hypothetical protein E7256_13180 [Lachnospiraceae bacterium]|nr:hypothetical protein [Lachnospiraceae bacterium]
MNTFGRSITIILACILLFLFPVQYDAELTGTIADAVVENGVYELTDKVIRNKAFTKMDYEMFMNEFDMADAGFHLEFEVAKSYSDGEQDYMFSEFYDELGAYFTIEEELTLERGDYITIYLIKDMESDLLKLQELFFHKGIRKEQIVYGGRIS